MAICFLIKLRDRQRCIAPTITATAISDNTGVRLPVANIIMIAPVRAAAVQASGCLTNHKNNQTVNMQANPPSTMAFCAPASNKTGVTEAPLLTTWAIAQIPPKSPAKIQPAFAAFSACAFCLRLTRAATTGINSAKCMCVPTSRQLALKLMVQPRLTSLINKILATAKPVQSKSCLSIWI